MTVETEVANLTTAVDNLASAVNVSKATLDTSVSSASSSADDALDSKIAAAVSAAAAELQRSAADAAAAYAATSSALAQTYHISGRNAVNGVMPTFLADFSGQVIDFPNRISSDETVGLRTQTNSAGVIQWAPHNLLKSSEDFASSNWTKTATTVTSNAAMAPDGTLTADKISHTSTSAGLVQNVTVVDGVPYVAGYCVKHIDHQWIVFYADGTYTWFDMQNGVLGTDNSDGASVIALADGWYYVVFPETASGTSYQYQTSLVTADGSTIETSGTSAYIWGAHLYRNDLGGMAKVPTSDRALAALEYYVPNKAVVIGPNLVSNGTFDSSTAGWTDASELSGSTSWDASGAISLNNPAGSSSEEGMAYQIITTVAGKHYKLDYDKLSGGSCIVQLGSSGIGSSGIFQSGNDTISQSVYFTAVNTTTYITLRNFIDATPALIDNITVEEVDRNPSAARHLPRRENHVYDGTAWVKGLLVEPDGATNYITESEDLTAWTVTSTSVAAAGDWFDITTTGATSYQKITNTVSAGAGTYTIWSLVDTTNSTSTYCDIGVAGTGLGGSYTSSYYKFDYATATMAVRSNGGAQDTFVYDFGSGVYLIGFSISATTITGAVIHVLWNDNTSGVVTRARRPQLENNSAPTSYIPTSGSAVSRGAETVTIPASVMDSLGLFNTVAVDGTELNTGATDVGTDWTDNGDGSFTCDGSGVGNLVRFDGIGISSGSVYAVTATVSTPTTGKVQVKLNGGRHVTIPNGQASTTYLAGATSDGFQIVENSGFDGTVSDISVKEIHRRGIGVQMHGYMSYGDDGTYNTVLLGRWYLNADNYIHFGDLSTNSTDTGRIFAVVESGGTNDYVSTAADHYSPDVNVPFKIAARYLDNSLQGAADGTATTENTTPVGLPDLSGVDLEVAYSGPAIHITKFNIFAENTKSSDGTFKMEETFLQRASS